VVWLCAGGGKDDVNSDDADVPVFELTNKDGEGDSVDDDITDKDDFKEKVDDDDNNVGGGGADNFDEDNGCDCGGGDCDGDDDDDDDGGGNEDEKGNESDGDRDVNDVLVTSTCSNEVADDIDTWDSTYELVTGR